MRSHDLNRLLDKPGCKHQLSGNIFCDSTARERRWDHPSRLRRWIRASLQRSRAKARIFWLKHSAFHSAWPERIRSSHKGTGALMAGEQGVRSPISHFTSHSQFHTPSQPGSRLNLRGQTPTLYPSDCAHPDRKRWAYFGFALLLEKLGSQQNYHKEKRKLDPAIATRASLIFIGFQALNQPPAQVNHAQAAIKNVAT